MDELPLVGVGESGIDDDPRFECKIYGDRVDFVVQLKVNMKCNALHTEQMPFYLCGAHGYLYKNMQSGIELKDYFRETIKENQ